MDACSHQLWPEWQVSCSRFSLILPQLNEVAPQASLQYEVEDP